MGFRVGLTGGIGSGKTTVSRYFRELGVPVIDADEVARRLVEPGTPGLKALEEHFGQSFILDGHLDRRRLRAVIFSDINERHWVEALLHPMIQEEMLRLADQHSEPYVILEIPLLFEAGYRSLVNRVLVVEASRDLQIQRVRQRDGVTAEQVEAVMQTQMDSKERCQLASDVINNADDVDALRVKVELLHAKYLSEGLHQG